MIEIKGLTKRYPGTEVYENFNLTLKDGEITCILGESGSGKTTLLNCVAGLTDYTGEITKTDCSYIFQSPRLVPNLTVFNNLKLICSDVEKITKMLDRVGLYDKAKSYPKALSGGQAQRVAIARAFLFGGQTLLMDEPFSSLDLKLKREMTELFFEVWMEDKRTVLMVTHDVDEAIAMAHRIIVLHEGKTVLDLSPSERPPRNVLAVGETRAQLVSALIGK